MPEYLILMSKVSLLNNAWCVYPNHGVRACGYAIHFQCSWMKLTQINSSISSVAVFGVCRHQDRLTEESKKKHTKKAI